MFALKTWWHAGFHEGRALAFAVGILTAYQGFATLYTPSAIILYYGFTANLYPFVITPTVFGVAAVYTGMALVLCYSGKFRYAMLALAVALWSYIAYGFITDSLYPIITAAPPLATITIALVALVRARAWLGR